MDAKEAIHLEARIMGEVRKLLNAKFQTSNEELSTDSKVAVQQLATAVSAIRDELSKTHSSFRVISLTVDDVNQRIGILGNELKDSRVLKDINDLKISVDKLWDNILAGDVSNRLGVLEKAISDVVNRVGSIERLANLPPKRNGTETQPSTIDQQVIRDVTVKIGDVLAELQGTKLDVEVMQKQIDGIINNSAKAGLASVTNEDLTALKERIVTIELTISSLTNAMINSETTRNQVQQAEIDLLKARLDQADKKAAEFELKLKGLTTSLAPPQASAVPPVISATLPTSNSQSPAPAAGSPMYDPQIQVPSPAPVPQATPIVVQQPVKIAVAQPAPALQNTPTPIIQSAFAPFGFVLK